ncbi:MAG: flavodoxin [Candidatus Gastranaerophilaceae bacterium]
MKKITLLMTMFVLLFGLAGCGAETSQNEVTPTLPEYTENSEEISDSENDADVTEAVSKSLVVYFSCTGNTETAAKKIAELTNSDTYEIVPEVPYTDEDLNYNNDDCRANKEMNDDSARPAIGSEPIDMSNYNTVFIGYPIWWGTMPRIINTFLDTYDLSGKTVMPFCTSGGSGISTSVSDIKKEEPEADVKDGLRVKNESDSDIADWLSRNGL